MAILARLWCLNSVSAGHFENGIKTKAESSLERITAFILCKTVICLLTQFQQANFYPDETYCILSYCLSYHVKSHCK